MSTDSSPQDGPAPAGRNGRRRKVGLFVILLIVVLGGVGYGTWWTLIGSRYVSTDNAYVQGNIVQITPQIGGTVLAIHADDTDRVEAGQLLVELDAADAQVALEQAQAQLAKAVREVQSVYVNNAALQANIELREADALKATSELERAREDLQRRQQLGASGAISGEELRHAQKAVDAAASAAAAARAAVDAAREQLAMNRALTGDTPVAQHPNVLAAAARVREAYLAAQRTTLPAPVTGYVARRSVQVGQRVQAGAPLMAIIPLDQVWVEANFKEVQLRDMRLEQPVTLTADVYGRKVEYHGRVVGLGAGTGAAFALLPAQNATGNWIKVVQRVPVRIALNADEVREHPLRVGLSMTATVDISNRDGGSLAAAPRTVAVAQTRAFEINPRDAEALVRKIIDANLGRRQPTRAQPGSAALALHR